MTSSESVSSDFNRLPKKIAGRFRNLPSGINALKATHTIENTPYRVAVRAAYLVETSLTRRTRCPPDVKLPPSPPVAPEPTQAPEDPLPLPQAVSPVGTAKRRNFRPAPQPGIGPLSSADLTAAHPAP